MHKIELDNDMFQDVFTGAVTYLMLRERVQLGDTIEIKAMNREPNKAYRRFKVKVTHIREYKKSFITSIQF